MARCKSKDYTIFVTKQATTNGSNKEQKDKNHMTMVHHTVCDFVVPDPKPGTSCNALDQPAGALLQYPWNSISPAKLG